MAKGSWSMKLVESLNDPATHIISSAIAVVIKDKFPKSKHHYLVMPRERILSIYHLKACHSGLLSEMHLLAINVIEVNGCWKEDFKIGFHAKPSMQQLHMHVISKDFISPCLKTKKHWNSFNTKLFISYEELFHELNEHGEVRKLDESVLKELELTVLKCNQCNYVSKTMPALKDHLISHLENKDS